MITDIAASRCDRASEEMQTAVRNLRTQIDSISNVCTGLRASGSAPLITIANRLAGSVDALENKRDTMRVLSQSLQKITGMYRRTEQETTDFGEEVRQIGGAAFARIDLRPVYTEVAAHFETF